MTSIKLFQSAVSDGSMLNRHDPDDSSVIENRRKFFDKHNVPFEKTIRLNTDLLKRATVDHETNYCKFIPVDLSNAGDGMNGDSLIVADAIVTTQKDLPLMLPVADCVGAVLFDPVNTVLMMSHLGRHSLEQKGAVQAVHYLKEHFQTKPEEIQVWLTPAAGKDSYKIWALDNKGMKEATLEQLAEAGVLSSNIQDDSRHTTEDETLYSYSEFLKGHRNEDGDHMIAAVMQ